MRKGFGFCSYCTNVLSKTGPGSPAKRGGTRMKNVVGREIPDEVLQRYGKEGYKGAYARDGVRYQKAAPRAKAYHILLMHKVFR